MASFEHSVRWLRDGPKNAGGHATAVAAAAAAKTKTTVPVKIGAGR